jgi:hypothetical protein
VSTRYVHGKYADTKFGPVLTEQPPAVLIELEEGEEVGG